MSHCDFLTRQTEDFRRSFQQADGWEIYKIDYAVFASLPALLDSHPEAVKSSNAVRGIRHETIYPENTDSHIFSIEKRGWVGEYGLVWKGEPLHVRALHRNEHDYRYNFLVAAKSFDAARRLYEDLLEFNQRRAREKPSPTVITNGGADITLQTCAWEDLILPPAMLQDIRSGVDAFFGSREDYRRFNVPYKRGFIFSGPAGCGKTLAAKTIVYNTRLPAYLLTQSADREHTARSIDWAFESAKEQAPAIILIEELEKFSEAAYVSTILNLMDGLSSMRGVLVIATTNHPERIDPALLLRPSRFDRVWQFALPCEEDRLRLLRLKARGLFDDADLRQAARLSAGFSMAYVQEIFASGLSIAMREGRGITGADLVNSVELLKKQIKSAPEAADDMLTAEKQMGFSVSMKI